MLPKTDRLKDRRLFNLAFKKKQVLRSTIVTAYYLYEKNDVKLKVKKPKAAFIVSTKIDKRATERNLFKRRMKASFNALKKPIVLSQDEKYSYSVSVLILIANPKIKDASYSEIKNTIKTLINKLELKGLNYKNLNKSVKEKTKI